MTADPIKKCPECRKLKVKRLIGAGAGLLFKGSGFYETDYRSSSYESSAKADKESATKEAGGSKSEKPKTDGAKKKKGESKPKGTAKAN